MTRKKTPLTPRKAQDHVKRMQALEMRAARATYQQIADALYNGAVTTAYRNVHRALEDQEYEAVEEVRAQEILLLDRMVRPLIPKVSKGDEKAVHAILKIMERRAKFLGLDAPTQVETHGDGGFAIMVNPALLPEDADLTPTGPDADPTGAVTDEAEGVEADET